MLTGETHEDEVAPRAAAAWLAHAPRRGRRRPIQVADGEDGMLIIGAAPGLNRDRPVNCFFTNASHKPAPAWTS